MAEKKVVSIEKQEDDGNVPGKIGDTGLQRYGGMINEEFLTELKGAKGLKIYREMSENDPVIGAFLFTIEMLIRNAEFTAQPKSDESQDIEAAEFINEAIEEMDTPFVEVLVEILSMLPYGYSVHEPVYKKDEQGRIVWSDIPIRGQDTITAWQYDDKGNLTGIKQTTTTNPIPVTIPIERLLLFRPKRHKNNPEGRSVLRSAYRPWWFKKRIEEIEGIGIERDLAGLPVIYAPVEVMKADANASEKAVYAELKNIVRNIRRDEQEGIIMPNSRDDSGNRRYELELLSTGGSRQFNTTEIISRYDKRIAMTVIADFILLGQDKVGSFSLSSDKTRMFASAISAWLKTITGVFNNKAIPDLLKLNGKMGKVVFVHGDLETPDLEMLANYISKLAAAGYTWAGDEDVENILRVAAGLPKLPEGAMGEDSDFNIGLEEEEGMEE